MSSQSGNFTRFLFLWGGELLSTIGSGLTSFGLSVYVFAQTGSAGSMALVALLAFLPTLLLSVPAGVLADRYDRRVLMMVGDGCSAIGILFILVCLFAGDVALWQICVGVFVSSTFSSLLEPSYRATITDLLTQDEYSRASGMVSVAGSARYLIAPILAAALLALSDVKLLLLVDICTIFPTIVVCAAIRKAITRPVAHDRDPFMTSMREGWQAVMDRRGIFVLVIVSAAITCFIGTFQILAEPMILSFADSTALGIAETFCACGMLVSALILGARGIKRGFARKLSYGLFVAALGMVGFGLLENLYVMCLFGFVFFAALPVANNCLDYLVRVNIPDELQGRVWGLIGFLSQIGYVIAYSTTGAASDGIALLLGISVGRGAACFVIGAGVLLAVTALLLLPLRSVQALEKDPPCSDG